MRNGALRKAIVFLIIVEIIIPLVLYIAIMSARSNVSIYIHRSYNTELAYRALQLVESSDVLSKLNATNVTFVCNRTLEEFIGMINREDFYTNYYVEYEALSLEDNISVKLRIFNVSDNETTLEIRVVVNSTIFLAVNTTIGVSGIYPPFIHYLFISDSLLSRINETTNIMFHGVIVRSVLSYFESCTYYLLCGHGYEIHQIVVFDRHLSPMLVFVMRYEVVS